MSEPRGTSQRSSRRATTAPLSRPARAASRARSASASGPAAWGKPEKSCRSRLRVVACRKGGGGGGGGPARCGSRRRNRSPPRPPRPRAGAAARACSQALSPPSPTPHAHNAPAARPRRTHLALATVAKVVQILQQFVFAADFGQVERDCRDGWGWARWLAAVAMAGGGAGGQPRGRRPALTLQGCRSMPGLPTWRVFTAICTPPGAVVAPRATGLRRASAPSLLPIHVPAPCAPPPPVAPALVDPALPRPPPPRRGVRDSGSERSHGPALTDTRTRPLKKKKHAGHHPPQRPARRVRDQPARRDRHRQRSRPLPGAHGL